MKTHLSFILLLVFSSIISSCQTNKTPALLISEQAYKEAVYASWIGQIIGNTYGLCYEFQFIEDPGPDTFPYGYTWTLDLLKEYNGAFSDDDTDIEYMYLTQMEKNGIEPTYLQLAEAWKTHVKEKVWCANRAAVTLMHAGHYPPITGSMDYNTQWCQIDPQLVNEIWAVTAPGMIEYAVGKSEFAARITNDSFGIEPTLHYAAMYSAAFFEKDIPKLIDIGTDVLPPHSKFAKIVAHVKQLHQTYPDDWQTARKIIKDNYLVQAEYNKYAWPPIDANLNGAYGIMALLYGEGDFQKTLDYSCAFGMDADNQAATMCGLLGIINGLEGIPEALMYPVEALQWEKPFNDFYKMVTREQLPDASLTDMVSRMAQQGEKVILAKGGEVITKNGQRFYRINSEATFTPPFELNPLPDFFIEINKPFSYPIYTGGISANIMLETEGNLPPGFSLVDQKLKGIPTQSGIYEFTIIAKSKEQKKQVPVKIKVHSKNLAPSAAAVVFNKNSVNHNIEIIRDENTAHTYNSTKPGDAREIDFYGYIWEAEKSLSSLSFNNGIPSEFCGWFTSFEVEYLAGDEWVKLDNFHTYPDMNLDNNQWLKPSFIDYEISFQPIRTKGIRISGLSGGIPKDASNAYLGMQYYTAISELRIFED
jgi:hypothetical protein